MLAAYSGDHGDHGVVAWAFDKITLVSCILRESRASNQYSEYDCDATNP
jgi:hypothetical protein